MNIIYLTDYIVKSIEYDKEPEDYNIESYEVGESFEDND